MEDKRKPGTERPQDKQRKAKRRKFDKPVNRGEELPACRKEVISWMVG